MTTTRCKAVGLAPLFALVLCACPGASSQRGHAPEGPPSADGGRPEPADASISDSEAGAETSRDAAPIKGEEALTTRPREPLFAGTAEAPPAPPASVRLKAGPGYTIAVSRSISGEEIWVTYPRPEGVAPRVEYARIGAGHLPPDGVTWRIVPTFGGELFGEHGGFGVLRDDHPELLTGLSRSASRYPLLRAPRTLGSPEAPAAALAATERVLETHRCPGGAELCYLYGTEEDLRAARRREGVKRERGGWQLRRASAPRGSETLEAPAKRPHRATLGGRDLELHVVPIGPARRRVRPYAAFVRAGAETKRLFTFEAGGSPMTGELEPPTLRSGLSAVGGHALAWVWEPERVALAAAMFNPATLEVFDRPLIVRDRSDTSDVDCANVLTDTRPVVVLTEGSDALSVGLLWSSRERVLFFDRLGGPARFIDAHHPGDLDFYNTSTIPPVYSLRGDATDAGAYLEAILPTLVEGAFRSEDE